MIEILNNESLHIDEIQVRSGMSIDKVSAALVMMELKGMVKQMDGVSYMLLKEGSGDYLAK